MWTNFSNCPAHVLAPGLSHVAVGFVDLGMLLDSDFLSRAHETAACFQFRGIEASPFAVAKSLVLWEMLQTVGTKEKWIVQVWFSSVWSVGATNAFLAAAQRIDTCLPSTDHPSQIRILVHHWASSKGVGLKKHAKRQALTRQESSNALYFAHKEDRIEMIRYHLTGRIFLLPIQDNPLNTTSGFLAKRCFKHWANHYFVEAQVSQVIDKQMVDCVKGSETISEIRGH